MSLINIIGALVLSAPLAWAAASESPRFATDTFVTESCAGCHAFKAPEDAAAAFAQRQSLGGPPLYYAGDKYRQEWLTSWLQNPARIHPAGYFPPGNVRPTPEGDKVDEDALVDHPVLDADKAKAVAAHLMGLRPHAERLSSESYEPGQVPLRMGRLDFRRFKGCVACHQDERGEGGLSGPELYTAMDRLNPAYVVSFVRDPASWNPDTLMPVLEMNDAAIHKLVNYLNTIAGE